MSHFSPTLWTQVPTFEAMAAIQIARKRWLLSGANGERASVTDPGYPECSAKKISPPRHQGTKKSKKKFLCSSWCLGVLVVVFDLSYPRNALSVLE
jgi:hypothetical protein